MRGHKADIFDGGHRVPFIVRWPAQVKGGQRPAAHLLTDLMATAADILGQSSPKLPVKTASASSPLLKGEKRRRTPQHHPPQHQRLLRHP